MGVIKRERVKSFTSVEAGERAKEVEISFPTDSTRRWAANAQARIFGVKAT